MFLTLHRRKPCALKHNSSSQRTLSWVGAIPASWSSCCVERNARTCSHNVVKVWKFTFSHTFSENISSMGVTKDSFPSIPCFFPETSTSKRLQIGDATGRCEGCWNCCGRVLRLVRLQNAQKLFWLKLELKKRKLQFPSKPHDFLLSWTFLWKCHHQTNLLGHLLDGLKSLWNVKAKKRKKQLESDCNFLLC